MKKKVFSVRMTYDDMNLVYQKLQLDISDEDLKRIEVSLRVAQISYGNPGAFYEY